MSTAVEEEDTPPAAPVVPETAPATPASPAPVSSPAASSAEPVPPAAPAAEAEPEDEREPEVEAEPIQFEPKTAQSPFGDRVDLSEIQNARMPQLMAWADQARVKNFPPRTRHQLVADLARVQLSAGKVLTATGVVDLPSENPKVHGVLRWAKFNFAPCPEDATIPSATVQELGLRAGLKLSVIIRPGRGGGEKALTVGEVTAVEGIPLANWKQPTHFEALTPLHPNRRLVLESGKFKSPTVRAIDLVATLGCGQRALILAPPRVGKTVMLKDIARAIRAGSPDVKLLVLLIDERPEEVTDFRRELDPGTEIYASTFDEASTRHSQVADLVSERARRLVELGHPVVLLLDSLTRLARGFNNLQGGKGRTMSGGLDAKALMKPKKFFGAARNTEEGGSLTIVATCLVDTGSRMDEVIFEEFKGTGNMEIHLDRSLSDKRLWPAIHVTASGTRNEDLLFHPQEYALVAALRKQLAQLPAVEAMELLIQNIHLTQNNAELLLKGLRGL